MTYNIFHTVILLQVKIISVPLTWYNASKESKPIAVYSHLSYFFFFTRSAQQSGKTIGNNDEYDINSVYYINTLLHGFCPTAECINFTQFAANVDLYLSENTT